jgi:ubiquinone/menaquinone biosynthesis C-methylase UbiE
MSEKIQNYWEERAKENYNKNTATTNDIHLRDLEISTLIETIHQIKSENINNILDIGCGDGRSILDIASQFPDCYFTGIDFSETMVKIANKNLGLKNNLKDRVNFIVGDVTKLYEVIDDKKFDIIISDRCLINLDSSTLQNKAISDISNLLTPSGNFIAIENFIEGHNTMNDSRRAMGLPEIPIRWHNKYFNEDEFIENAKKYFRQIEIRDFSSSYYFATRIIYSKMCQMQGETPDYNHKIHQLATKLPWTGKFSPIKLLIMKKIG